MRMFFAILTMMMLLLPGLFQISFSARTDNDWQENGGYKWEEYDPACFEAFRSTDNIIAYADSVCGAAARQSLDYAETLASVIRKRFYHGYSYYTPSDNWIAWACGKLFWDHLHAIVLPDDILKHPNASCSQQAIVLMECFRKAGITYREVALDGHFVVEGKINNKWYFFDTDLEPQFVERRRSLERLLEKDELIPAYSARISREEMEKIFSSRVYKPENAPPARNAAFFHRVTRVASIASIFALPAFVILLMLRRKSRNSHQV